MINRAEQNWPAEESSDVFVCACGAPCDANGVCSEPECVTQCFGQPISSYSRAEAIADGVLVDMETEDFQRSREGLGLLWPVAMTATAFSKCVELTDAAKKLGEELSPRYWSVCFALRCAIARAKAAGESGELLEFSVCCVQQEDRAQDLKLKAVFGPADDSSPCITIMLPSED